MKINIFRTEFWSALLEKAFAKFAKFFTLELNFHLKIKYVKNQRIYGSYEALESGYNCDALEFWTGGLVEYYSLKKTPKTLLKKVQRGLQMGNIYGCVTAKTPNEDANDAPIRVTKCI